MSPSPQVTPWTTCLLTKSRPPPCSGVGQNSSAAELIASRFTGAPQPPLLLDLVATQMSRPPSPPGRFEAMYRLRPAGDWSGEPSSDMVFSSELLPGIVSIFSARLHAVKCGPAVAASAAPDTAPTASANASAHLRVRRARRRPAVSFWRPSIRTYLLSFACRRVREVTGAVRDVG